MENGDKVMFEGKTYIYGEGEYNGNRYAGLWAQEDWCSEGPPSFCIVETPEEFEPFDDGSWGYALSKNVVLP